LNETIGRHLRSFLHPFMERYDRASADIFLQDIIKSLSNLEDCHASRLHIPPHFRSNSHNITQWKNKTAGTTIIEGVINNHISLLQLFGITLIDQEEGLYDDFMGVKDAILLGLIPKSLFAFSILFSDCLIIMDVSVHNF